MLLSIVTINKNNSAGLNKTIESVISQSCKCFEYIIIDGASNDDSLSTIISHFPQISASTKSINSSMKFEDGFSVKLISEPDSGIFNAMNKGANMASGNFILYLNSGDCLSSKDVVQNIYNEIVADGERSQIYIGKQIVIDDRGKTIRREGFSKDEISLLFIYLYQVPHQSTIISTELQLANPYHEHFRTASDWDFFLKTIIIQNVPVGLLNTTIAYYNSGGVSSNTKLHDYECELIFRSLFPARIVADYMKDAPNKYEIYRLGWLLRHRFAYKICRFITSVGMRISSY